MTREYTGLKILGILSLIGGLLMLLGGIMFVGMGGAIAEAGEESIWGIVTLIPFSLAIVAIGAVMIVIGLLYIFLGYNVYKHKPWAYWVYFVLTIIGFIGSLVAFAWFGIIIGGIIIWYLWTIRKSFMKDGDTTMVWRD